MFGRTVTLFRVFGFAVRIDPSWLIVMALVVWSLAGGVFPKEYPGLGTAAYLAMGAAGAAGLFASIVVHELCHSLVARLYGLPITGITLFIFGGVAEMSEEPPSAKSEFFMALAGPAASLVIGGVVWPVALLGQRWGWPTHATAVLAWLGMINVMLAAFNMIPGFPLDGGRVLRSILWYARKDLRWATSVAARAGIAMGVGLIALGVISLLLGDPIGGLWWILIGLFLRSAAKQGYQQVLIRGALAGERVRHFMSGPPVTVPPGTSLADLVESYIYRYHFQMFPVANDGDLLGCVTAVQVKDVPLAEWPGRTVADIAQPVSPDNSVSADEDASAALMKMHATGVTRLMVLDAGRLVGILTLKDLLKFLSLKVQMESGK